jgi:DNA recombination protein RmuC
MLNQNMTGMQERLDRVSQGLNERLDNAARIINNVNKELGTMQEIGRNMQALQDFLKSPKLRGNIGEQVLKQMLDQYFPPGLYELQYRFKEGHIPLCCIN